MRRRIVGRLPIKIKIRQPIARNYHQQTKPTLNLDNTCMQRLGTTLLLHVSIGLRLNFRPKILIKDGRQEEIRRAFMRPVGKQVAGCLTVSARNKSPSSTPLSTHGPRTSRIGRRGGIFMQKRQRLNVFVRGRRNLSRKDSTIQRNWAGCIRNTIAAISRASGTAWTALRWCKWDKRKPQSMRVSYCSAVCTTTTTTTTRRSSPRDSWTIRGGGSACGTIDNACIVISGRASCFSFIDGGCRIFTVFGGYFWRFFENKSASARSLLRHVTLQPS